MSLHQTVNSRLEDMKLTHTSALILSLRRVVCVRKQEKYVIWPAYFDQSKSRSEGRRIAKSQALQSPRVDEIQKAAEKLGLQPEMRLEVAYPGQSWVKTGMLLINKKGSKLEIMRRIAREIAAQRAQQSS
jgi:signal recognition particle subunit SRP19